MPSNTKLNIADLIQTKNLYDTCGKNLAATGRELGISRQAVEQRLNKYKKVFDDYVPKYKRIDGYIENAEKITDNILVKGYKNFTDALEKEGVELCPQTAAKHLNVDDEILKESRALRTKKDIRSLFKKLKYKQPKINSYWIFTYRKSLYNKIYYYWGSYSEFIEYVEEN